jgi:hypothetical protein
VNVTQKHIPGNAYPSHVIVKLEIVQNFLFNAFIPYFSTLHAYGKAT